MITKDIKDYNKSLPTITDMESKGIMVSDANGNQYLANNSAFACRVGGSFPVGTVLRIRNLTSVLISLRGHNGGRVAFVWVSSYASGTSMRSAYFKFTVADSYYQFYINGNSDNIASVYVKLTGNEGSDDISIVSLAGEIPKLEQVPSLPSDAARILYVP